MKNKSIISLIIFLMGFGVVTSSCEDMLTPDMDRYAPHSGQDTVYSYLGILKSIQDIAERYVILGEARGDLATTTSYTSDSIYRIATFDPDMQDGESALLRLADYYKVINQCNFYLNYADTTAIKNNTYYMKREYAQVQAMRAWTYMQMVLNYGNVPFVSKPISDTKTALEIEKQFEADLKNALETSKVVANTQNLYTLLCENGLERALQLQNLYGIPSYGAYATGSGIGISAIKCVFPVDLVLGDLALMAGKYEKAAEYLYNYIDNNETEYFFGSARYLESRYGYETFYMPMPVDWTDDFTGFSDNSTITVIPGAANKSFGRMLTAHYNVFGFKASSSQSTSGSVEENPDEGEDPNAGVSTTGSIRLTPNEKYRQLVASTNYIGVNNDQQYCFYTEPVGSDQPKVEYPIGLGDARVHTSIANSRIDGEEFNFINKYAPSSSFNFRPSYEWMTALNFQTLYGIKIYKPSQVMLRYAEAVNRAGFPQFAFAVLKDGLNDRTIPAIRDSIAYELGELGDTIGSSTVYYSDGTTKYRDSVAYYISYEELKGMAERPYMDFVTATTTATTNIIGVHALGCGTTAGLKNTEYSYDKMVAGKIVDERVRRGEIDRTNADEEKDKLSEMGVNKAVTEGLITKDDIINAVEELIVDELALETAFEGNRFNDLVRISGHKSDGTNWFAWKIAHRNYKPNSADYDVNLYGKLQNRNNWFLPMPR